jgi:hypothetical protein
MRGLLFRIKNEGTNKISGARDKALGVVAGVADMCLLVNNTAVFIEFKTLTGIQSLSQKEWENKIKQAGYNYYLINSFEKFFDICQELVL